MIKIKNSKYGLRILNIRILNLFRISHKNGFTLLETLVAFSVLLAALVGPVALIMRGLVSSSFARNNLIAYNLAQEGIELVRQIRENNKICEIKGAPGWNWRRDFNGAGTLNGANRTIDATGSFPVACVAGVTINNPAMGGNCDAPTSFLKFDAQGHYGYIAGNDTIFQRCISISEPGSDDGTIPKSAMLEITSRVMWNERSIPKNIELKDKFYNWQ